MSWATSASVSSCAAGPPLGLTVRASLRDRSGALEGFAFRLRVERVNISDLAGLGHASPRTSRERVPQVRQCDIRLILFEQPIDAVLSLASAGWAGEPELTRLTTAFSKKLANHAHTTAVALYVLQVPH